MHLVIVHKNTSNVGTASLANWTIVDEEKQSFLFANFQSCTPQYVGLPAVELNLLSYLKVYHIKNSAHDNIDFVSLCIS